MLASKWRQPTEKPFSRFVANVPRHVYFPPFKTRPNVAVGSPFRPGGGGEGLGERGGNTTQRLKNERAAMMKPMDRQRRNWSRPADSAVPQTMMAAHNSIHSETTSPKKMTP